MTVRGSLRTMSAEDLLDWVRRRSISGTITMQWSSLTRTLAFDAGVVAGSSSSDPNSDIGSLLLDAGLIDRTALDRAAAAQEGDGRDLAGELLASGAVGAEQLTELLTTQARESLCDVLSWIDGSFTVERHDSAPLRAFPVGVYVARWVIEARRGARRWQEIHKLLPNPEAALSITDARRIANADDSDEDRRLLG
ncbi:MAG: DUF4388 domain-containing protein, partial [Myxococcota bacterium]